MAEISIIIPCYNVVSYIDRCLMSITTQTIGIDKLQIICIDDASTDNTWNLLQVWEQRFPENILLIHCDQNGRQGKARNIGLDYASAKWIAFIDADDWIEPDYFEKLYAPTQFTDYDAVCCRNRRDFSTEMTFFDDKNTGQINRALTVNTIENRKAFFNLQSAGYGAWGKIIRKDILTGNHILFPENLAYEDSYWGPLFHFYLHKIYLVEEFLYHYYVNPASTVLQKNVDYHTDWLTVQCMKWNEWVKRGFLVEYREELEYDFLCTCYLGFLKILFLRFETPSYALYQLAREITLERVPDYINNIYYKEGFSQTQKLLLNTLSLSLDKKQLIELAEYARKTGI